MFRQRYTTENLLALIIILSVTVLRKTICNAYAFYVLSSRIHHCNMRLAMQNMLTYTHREDFKWKLLHWFKHLLFHEINN